MQSSSRVRSIASASDPPSTGPTIAGTSWARLTSPTSSDEWVSRYTWYATATTVICDPVCETM
jgi:hypothetical protein